MFKHKFIISLIGIYIFGLCVLPLVVSNAVGILCENFSHNSQYKIEVISP